MLFDRKYLAATVQASSQACTAARSPRSLLLHSMQRPGAQNPTLLHANLLAGSEDTDPTVFRMLRARATGENTPPCCMETTE